MANITRLLVNLSLLLGLSAAVSAQKPAEPKPSSASVTVAVSLTDAGLRFTALGPIRQTRLEVFDAAGAPVFDSGFLPGGVRNWSPQQAGQMTPVDGAYQCVLTARDLAGRLSLKQGAIEVASGQVALRLGDAEGAGEVKRQQDSLSPIGGERPALAITAHDGRDGHVVSTTGDLTLRTGDFFSGKDEERVRITEEGRVGIGTDKPKATLDVAGEVRAREGFRFADGTRLNADGGKLLVTNAKGDPLPAPKAAGTGTLGRLAKWTETGGAGTLGDSVVTETAAGNVGIGNPNPQSLLQVGPHPGYGATTGLLITNNLTGTQYDRGFQLAPRQTASPLTNSVLIYALPTVNTGVTVPSQYGFFVDGRQGSGTITSYGAIATGQTASLGASNNTHLLMGSLAIPAGNFGIYDNTNYNSYFRGNVGIGTNDPAARLHVKGDSSYPATPPIAVIESTGDQMPLAFKIGATEHARIRSDSDGNLVLATLNGGAKDIYFRAGDDSSTDMFIQSSTDNVGIGTNGPAARLHVKGASSSPETPIAVIESIGEQMPLAFKIGAIQHARIRSDESGNLVLATLNGGAKDIHFRAGDDSDTDMLIQSSTGNVGIGTTSPQSKLQIGGGHAYVSSPGQGLILKSPNGSVCRLLSIDNSGNLVTSAVTCP